MSVCQSVVRSVGQSVCHFLNGGKLHSHTTIGAQLWVWERKKSKRPMKSTQMSLAQIFQRTTNNAKKVRTNACKGTIQTSGSNYPNAHNACCSYFATLVTVSERLDLGRQASIKFAKHQRVVCFNAYRSSFGHCYHNSRTFVCLNAKSALFVRTRKRLKC